MKFSECRAAVKTGGKWGFINTSGKMVIQPQFGDGFSDFSEGLASVKINQKEGYIDKTGKLVIEPQFYRSTRFSEGLAAIQIEEGAKWGFIDRNGKIVNPYLELLRKRYSKLPITGASFGLDTSYTPGQGLSLTEGKFDLEFLGGGLKAEGKSFTELSSYPRFFSGSEPFGSSVQEMQSFPALPPLKTGPGFQVMLSADLYKLFPGLVDVL